MTAALFHFSAVRKTYGLRRLPPELFPECRLPAEEKPQGADWRASCGRHGECRACPRCWTLSIGEMSIARGRTTAILGHSGSGKTTLLYLLALLHLPDPDCGRCELSFGSAESTYRFADGRWQGERNAAVSLDAIRRRRFGFVFQAGHLSSHLTAEQNVGLALALHGAPASTLRRRSEQLLARIEIPADRRHALPRHLSGGEYQRVAVARALAGDPEVLFADEPTGNLDPLTGRKVIDLLQDWRREGAARSLILVTHNLQHAFEDADDLVVLNGGEVVLAGRRDALRREQVEAALQRRGANS